MEPKVTIAHNPMLRCTIAISYTDTYLLFAYAICNDTDQWVKKVGVMKCLGRLKGKSNRIEFPNTYLNKCIKLNTNLGESIKKSFIDHFRSITSWSNSCDKEDSLIGILDGTLGLVRQVNFDDIPF